MTNAGTAEWAPEVKKSTVVRAYFVGDRGHLLPPLSSFDAARPTRLLVLAAGQSQTLTVSWAGTGVERKPPGVYRVMVQLHDLGLRSDTAVLTVV
jgi:hypothetical protein